ncbi:MAG: hypothetical protein PHU25_05525 [Deltaproteobacteria bacterium]|nr:hypothetical protein [Deltaproteobacteria bacterium]
MMTHIKTNLSVKLLIVAFLLSLLSGPIGSIMFWTQKGRDVLGFQFFEMFKIPMIIMTLAAIVSLVRSRKIYFSRESYLFILFFPLALIVGITEHGLNYYSLVHIYGILMPVVAISFGYHLVAYWNGFDSELWRKVFLVALVAVVPVVIYYFFLVRTEVIDRFGVSTDLSVLFAYFLVKKKRIGTFVVMTMALLTGKRVTQLSIVAILLFYFGQIVASNVAMKAKKNAILVIILALLSIPIADYFDLLGRYRGIPDAIISGTKSAEVSSGRDIDIECAKDYIDRSLGGWWLGGGVGSSYVVYISEMKRVLHYSHFMPLTYTMIMGVVFAVLLYGSMAYTALNAFRRVKESFVTCAFVGLAVASFSGPNLLVDPFPWVLLGGIGAQLKNIH